MQTDQTATPASRRRHAGAQGPVRYVDADTRDVDSTPAMLQGDPVLAGLVDYEQVPA